MGEVAKFNAFTGRTSIWSEFSSAVRVLLQNKYVFTPFWEYQTGQRTEEDWKNAFASANRAAAIAMGKGDTSTALSVVLSRLYTLRNQIVHGGATWQSSINRDQMRDAVSIMQKLVPTIIRLMMANPNTLWGDASYPVVD